MSDGLDKEGGISFSRKRDEKKKKPYGLAEPKEPEEEIEKPKRLDTEELLRQDRLGKKLVTSKRIQGSGFMLNGSAIIGAVFYLDSLLLQPDFVANLNMINDVFGLEIDFEKGISIIQEWKTQIIGFAISSQTMIMGYKDTCQKMKDRDTESFMEVVNDELEKVGI